MTPDREPKGPHASGTRPENEITEQLRWHGVVQPPGDGHGAFALVDDVGGGSEEGVGGGDSALVLLPSPDEEEDMAAPSGVLTVAPAGRGALSGGALGLPAREWSVESGKQSANASRRRPEHLPPMPSEVRGGRWWLAGLRRGDGFAEESGNPFVDALAAANVLRDLEAVLLGEGETAVLVTDGVLESELPNGEEFGSGRLLEVLRQHRRRAAREIVEHVYGVLREFAHDEEQTDDVTIIVCKRHSVPG